MSVSSSVVSLVGPASLLLLLSLALALVLLLLPPLPLLLACQGALKHPPLPCQALTKG